MSRMFNEKEVEAMCSQSYMRGSMTQYQTMSKAKVKKRKPFVEWVKQLIAECPVNKFV
jgi:hypothetical protein